MHQKSGIQVYSQPSCVNVEGTEPEDASLFTVRGRIGACREDSFDSSVELLVDCGATSDFMSMQTAKRARLPLYKLRNPGHVLTAGGVQVEVRYYTRAYVRVGELVFRHHVNVLEILPDVVLRLPWLQSYNPTVNWKERYADIQNGSNSYRLSFGESTHSTQPQFQAASKLDLLLILSSIASEASPVGIPTPHVKPVRIPGAIFGSLGVCIYVPASRHWLISYPPIHLT